MYLIKKVLKFFYFKTLKKDLKIHFSSNLDIHSEYATNSIFRKNSRVSNSKIGSQVTVEENAVVDFSEIGNNTSIHNNARIINTKIESFSYVAAFSQLSKVNVGKFCSIGPEVIIGLGIHPIHLISTSPVFYSTTKSQVGVTFTDKQTFEEYKNVSIGNDVWIGARVTILDGVTIGNGAIIAAGAVVVNDIKPYSIVGGIPAKLIRKRFSEETIQMLETIRWWNWPIEKIKSNSNLFSNEITETTLEKLQKEASNF